MVKFFPPIVAQGTPEPPDLYPDPHSKGCIGLVWGEAGTGKTTLVQQAALNIAAESNKTAIFFNTHQYPIFHRIERFITHYPVLDLTRIKIISISSFRQLRREARNLEYLSYLAEKSGQPVDLVIVDSLTNLYTLAIGKKETAMKRNQELNEIFGILKYMARQRNLSVLVTAEEKFLDVENIIERKPAGGRIMNYWVDFSIKITRGRNENTRLLLIRKDHSSTQEKLEAVLTDSGLFP
ncbi:MAG: hypothetical protein RBG13Loki_2917 [Promethearchaeota archaeon CR_4]|nr:MAG: hypothetical protein RBG13Loki_2917 [Candidatus Lokiarchaeota archaeon CR_4]